MPGMINFFNLLSQHYSRFASATFATARRTALVTLLGCGGLFVGAQGAIAAETVTLELDSGELTITIDQLRAFAETGELSPETQEFFDTNRQDAPTLQTLISDEVVIGSGVEEFFESSTGEFVIIQLDKLVNRSPNASTVEAVRTALRESYEDDGRFSILEIAELYPESNIYLDLRGLQTVYTDVKTFVERIRPVLETAREYLQELICDCEAVTTETSEPEPIEAVEPDAEPESEPAEMETEESDESSSIVPLSDETSSLQSQECTDATTTSLLNSEATDSAVLPISGQ